MIEKWKAIKTIYKKIYSHWITKMFLSILVIMILGTIFDSALGGVLGYIGFVLIWTAYIYWRQRKAFNEVWLSLVRSIEIMIFGKPQEKEYYEVENDNRSKKTHIKHSRKIRNKKNNETNE